MYTPDLPHDEMENGNPDWHEPFPEPQTIPSGWDLSEFLSASAPDSSGNSAACTDD